MNKEAVGRTVCNLSYIGFLTAGAICPLQCDDRKQTDKMVARTAATLLLSAVAVQLLKLLVPERRPDDGTKGSFPSGHSANTIALATLCAAQQPEQSMRWYLPALGISAARIALRRHHIRDVIVGSFLGFILARTVTNKIK
jgi:membrane-associated phospholipid phosphatase